MNIKEALKAGLELLKDEDLEDKANSVRRLLADLLNVEKEYLMIHDQEEIKEKLYDTFIKRIEKLKSGVPLQYILNKQSFMGMDFYVDENVLIPQPDTENLVEEAIVLAEKSKKSVRELIHILDMCTGSGAIAISLAKHVTNSIVYGADISKEAIKIAEQNSFKNMANVMYMKSDLFSNISELYKFNVIVSNPPYIRTDVIKTLSKQVQNEPHIALDGGNDGLDFYRKIAQESKKYLKENGYLAFEIGFDQKTEVENILKDNGYKNIYTKQDLGGNDRVVVGQI